MHIPVFLSLHALQDGAYADIVVKMGLIKLLSKRFDLCEEAYVLIRFVVSHIHS
jgi:hypothetical protein